MSVLTKRLTLVSRPLTLTTPRYTAHTFQYTRGQQQLQQLQQKQHYATQDYGSGDGHPVGENPQQQGRSRKTEEREHPGPEAPSVARGEKKEGGGVSSGSDGGGGHGEAQPKILNETAPKREEQSEDVKRHNDEKAGRSEEAG